MADISAPAAAVSAPTGAPAGLPTGPPTAERFTAVKTFLSDSLEAPPIQSSPTASLLLLKDIKSEPEDESNLRGEASSALAHSIGESLGNALKRMQPEETGVDNSLDNSNDTSNKRARIEVEANGNSSIGAGQTEDAASWDIGAMLRSALGSIGSELDAASAAQTNSNSAHASPSVATTGKPSNGGNSATQTSSTVASAAAPAEAVAPDSGVGFTQQSANGQREQKKMRFSQNPTYIVRSMGLPLLGSLAVQILHALSERLRPDALADVTSAESEVGQSYGALRDTFCKARQIFSHSSALLLPEELDIKELGDQETIQMANMATICASIFAADDVPLIDVHDHFLMTFLPETGALTSDLASLFLSLKLCTLSRELLQLSDDEPRRNFLERLFPADLEEQLKLLHPDAPLSAQEHEFLKTMMSKKETLLEAAKTAESRKRLYDTYSLDEFRNDLLAFLKSNSDVIMRYAETHSIEIPVEEEANMDEQAGSGTAMSLQDSLASLLSGTATSQDGLQASLLGLDASINGAAAGSVANTASAAEEGTATGAVAATSTVAAEAASSALASSIETDLTGLTSLIREKLQQEAQSIAAPPFAAPQANSAVTAANAALSSMQNTYASQLALYQSRTPSFTYQVTQVPQAAQTGSSSGGLPPNQSSPSAILYQRARQAAATKTVVHQRREGLHSTRRPWTADEEQALMAGLDMVKGPHWSQILQLFGANGTISDILKDRSQVQLKDKARNLKLFFLKTNSEMPYYLKCVTGELKTRAPSQAARKEAEERARWNNEEETARLRGIMALAGGLQDKNRIGGSNGAAGAVAMQPQKQALSAARPGLHQVVHQSLQQPVQHPVQLLAQQQQQQQQQAQRSVPNPAIQQPVLQSALQSVARQPASQSMQQPALQPTRQTVTQPVSQTHPQPALKPALQPTLQPLAQQASKPQQTQQAQQPSLAQKPPQAQPPPASPAQDNLQEQLEKQLQKLKEEEDSELLKKQLQQQLSALLPAAVGAPSPAPPTAPPAAPPAAMPAASPTAPLAAPPAPAPPGAEILTALPTASLAATNVKTAKPVKAAEAQATVLAVPQAAAPAATSGESAKVS